MATDAIAVFKHALKAVLRTKQKPSWSWETSVRRACRRSRLTTPHLRAVAAFYRLTGDRAEAKAAEYIEDYTNGVVNVKMHSEFNGEIGGTPAVCSLETHELGNETWVIRWHRRVRLPIVPGASSTIKKQTFRNQTEAREAWMKLREQGHD